MSKKKTLHPFDLDLTSLAILRKEFTRAEEETAEHGLHLDVKIHCYRINR